MIKEAYRIGWGSYHIPGYRDMTPERILADKRTAIVTVRSVYSARRAQGAAWWMRFARHCAERYRKSCGWHALSMRIANAGGQPAGPRWGGQ